MAIRNILTAPDPRLRQVSKPVAEVTGEVRTLMDDMLETMYAAPGIGLAAIQVGVPLRVIVMDLDGEDGGESGPRHFVNPEIVGRSDTLATSTEGCLSVPEFKDDVERPDSCRVRFLDYQGKAQDMSCTGLLATCIQHEMDHLEGVLFIDHLSRLKRSMVLKKLVKARRQQDADTAEPGAPGAAPSPRNRQHRPHEGAGGAAAFARPLNDRLHQRPDRVGRQARREQKKSA